MMLGLERKEQECDGDYMFHAPIPSMWTHEFEQEFSDCYLELVREALTLIPENPDSPQFFSYRGVPFLVASPVTRKEYEKVGNKGKLVVTFLMEDEW